MKQRFILFAVCVMVLFANYTPAVMTVHAAATISSVEITQVMGKGIDLASGEYYFMNTFVAEKPTAIQVVMNEEVNINASNMNISVYYEGSSQPISTLKPTNSGNRQIVEFIPTRAEVNGWQAGRYKFVANINGQTKTTEAIFNESKTFSILFISASVLFDGQVYSAPTIGGDTVSLRAQQLPVSENKFIRKYRKAPVSFGTGSAGYDIATPEGESRFLSDIEQYRLKSASQYDVVAVLVNSKLSTTSNTTGYTNCQHAIVVTLQGNPSAEALEATIAHEIGHIFGNGDEYSGGSFKINVNGAPYGVNGKEAGQSVQGMRNYLQHANDNNYSGILLHEVQNAYNPKTATPILRVSSFMGSSYKHWPTSMVWEQMYRGLVSNSDNILPRVYTDGKIVAKRPTENDLTSKEISDLKAEFRKMLNQVRAERGLPLYTEDKITIVGDKHLQKLAEEEFSKGNIRTIFDLTPFNNAVFAELKMLSTTRLLEAGIYEFEADEIDSMREFFRQSPCGHYWIEQDHFFLAFIESGNTTYYLWATGSGFYDNLPDDEVLQPQPDVLPLPEINPVTDEEVKPEDFYEPATFDPSGSTIDTPDTTIDVAAPSNPSGSSTTSDPSKPSTSTPTAEEGFASLSKEERLKRLLLDGFGLGYVESGQASYSYDELLDFYVWYLDDSYGVIDYPWGVDDVIGSAWEDALEAYDGVGEVDAGLVVEHLYRWYRLYPDQDVRASKTYREYYPLTYSDYGPDPRRSRYDTDVIHYDAERPAVVFNDAYYASFTQEERVNLLTFDFWDYGLTEAGFGNRSFEELMGFYAWYLGDAYSLMRSPEDVEAAIAAGFQEDYEKWDGAGQNSGLIGEYIFRQFQLYPAQEVRENSSYKEWYPYIDEVYGENPSRSKYDTDAIHYDDLASRYSDDDDVKDPDGGW